MAFDRHREARPYAAAIEPYASGVYVNVITDDLAAVDTVIRHGSVVVVGAGIGKTSLLSAAAWRSLGVTTIFRREDGVRRPLAPRRSDHRSSTARIPSRID